MSLAERLQHPLLLIVRHGMETAFGQGKVAIRDRLTVRLPDRVKGWHLVETGGHSVFECDNGATQLVVAVMDVRDVSFDLG